MTRNLRTAVVLALISGSALLFRAAPAPAMAAEQVMPPEATALCGDGSWSTADKKKGACSSHGGVKTWFGKPPKGATARCKDGTYSKAQESQGACSQHGGVAFWLHAK
jgi:hypothetical protein